MKIGYARVSTDEQSLDLQLDALKGFACDKLFTDKCSGSKRDRPGLEQALSSLSEGDTLVIWKLDRLGRSVHHLVGLVNLLIKQDIQFVSLTDAINTTTPAGRFFFHILAAMAEMERDLIRERTQNGIQAARARGRMGGRPKKQIDERVLMAKKMHGSKNFTVAEICSTLQITPPTLYRWLRLQE